MKYNENKIALREFQDRIRDRIRDIKDKQEIFGLPIDPENGYWSTEKKNQNPKYIRHIMIVSSRPEHKEIKNPNTYILINKPQPPHWKLCYATKVILDRKLDYLKIPLNKVKDLEKTLKRFGDCNVDELNKNREKKDKIKQIFRSHTKNTVEYLYDVDNIPETIAPPELKLIYEDVQTHIRENFDSIIIDMQPGDARAFRFNHDGKEKKPTNVLKDFGIACQNYPDGSGKAKRTFALVFEPKGKAARCCIQVTTNQLPDEKVKYQISQGKVLLVIKHEKNYSLGFHHSKTDTYKQVPIPELSLLSDLKENTQTIIEDQEIRQKILQLCHFLGGYIPRNTLESMPPKVEPERNKENILPGCGTKVRPAFRIDTMMPISMTAATKMLGIGPSLRRHEKILIYNGITNQLRHRYLATSQPYTSKKSTEKCVVYDFAANFELGPDLFHFYWKLFDNQHAVNLTLGDFICIIHQILAEHQAIHDFGYVYGDGKLENMLLRYFHLIQIIDFDTIKPITQLAEPLTSPMGTYHAWSPELWLKYWDNQQQQNPELKDFKKLINHLQQPVEQGGVNLNKVSGFTGIQAIQALANEFGTADFNELTTFAEQKYKITPATQLLSRQGDAYATGVMLQSFLRVMSSREFGDRYDSKEVNNIDNFSDILPTLTGDLEDKRSAFSPNHLLSFEATRMTLPEALVHVENYARKNFNTLTFSDAKQGENISLSKNYLQEQIQQPKSLQVLLALDQIDNYLTKTVKNPNTDDRFQDWYGYISYLKILLKNQTENWQSQAQVYLRRIISNFQSIDPLLTERLSKLSIYLKCPVDDQLLLTDLTPRTKCYRSWLQLARHLTKNFHDVYAVNYSTGENLASSVYQLQKYQQHYLDYQNIREKIYPTSLIQMPPADTQTNTYQLLEVTMQSLNIDTLCEHAQGMAPQSIKNLIHTIQNSPGAEIKTLLNPAIKKKKTNATRVTDEKLESPVETMIRKIETSLTDQHRNFNATYIQQTHSWAKLCHAFMKLQNTQDQQFTAANEELLIQLQGNITDFSNIFGRHTPYAQALSELKNFISTQTNAAWIPHIQQHIKPHVLSSKYFQVCDSYFQHRFKLEHPNYSSNLINKNNDYLYLLQFILFRISTLHQSKKRSLKSKDELRLIKDEIITRLNQSINQFSGRYKLCLQNMVNAFSDEDLVNQKLLDYLIKQVNENEAFFCRPFTNINHYLCRRNNETQGDNTRTFSAQDAEERHHAYLTILKQILVKINNEENEDSIARYILNEQQHFRIWGKRHNFADKLTALADAFTKRHILVANPQLHEYLKTQINYYTHASPLSGVKIFDNIIDILRIPLTSTEKWQNILLRISTADDNNTISTLLITEINDMAVTGKNQSFHNNLKLLQQAFVNGFIEHKPIIEYTKVLQKYYIQQNNLIKELSEFINSFSQKDLFDKLANTISQFRDSYFEYLSIRLKHFHAKADRPNFNKLLYDAKDGILYQLVSELKPKLPEQQKLDWITSIWQKIQTVTPLEKVEQEIKEEKNSSRILLVESKQKHIDEKTNPCHPSTNKELKVIILEDIKQQIKSLKEKPSRTTYCCVFPRIDKKINADITLLEKLRYHLQCYTPTDYRDFIEEKLLSTLKQLNDRSTHLGLEKYLLYFRKTQLNLLKSILSQLNTHESRLEEKTRTQGGKTKEQIKGYITVLQNPQAKPLPFLTMQSILELQNLPQRSNTGIISAAARKAYLESSTDITSRSKIITEASRSKSFI